MAIERRAPSTRCAAQRSTGSITTEQAVEALGPSRKSRWVAERRLHLGPAGVFRMAGAPRPGTRALHGRCASCRRGDRVAPLGRRAVGPDPPGGLRRGLRPPPDQPRPFVRRRSSTGSRTCARTWRSSGRACASPTRSARSSTSGSSCLVARAARARRGDLHTAAHDRRGAALRDALGRPGRNGTGIVRRAPRRQRLLTGRQGGERAREAASLQLARALRPPALTLQHEVWDAGRFVAGSTRRIPELKLAIEVDGFEHHSSPEAFQRDRTARTDLVALGWTVLRFTWDDVVHRPAHGRADDPRRPSSASPPPDPTSVRRLRRMPMLSATQT